MRNQLQRRLLVVLTYLCLFGLSASFPAVEHLRTDIPQVALATLVLLVVMIVGAPAGLIWIAFAAHPLLRAGAPDPGAALARARAAAYPLLVELLLVVFLLPDRWTDQAFALTGVLFATALSLPRTLLVWMEPAPARVRREQPAAKAIPLGAR